jgi:hypothetical protein
MNMAKLFRIDVVMCGTAYVRADDMAAALVIVESHCALHMEASVPEDGVWFGDVPVDDGEFTRLLEDDAPEISFSPALTFHGSSRQLRGPTAFTIAEMHQAAPDEDEEEA